MMKKDEKTKPEGADAAPSLFVTVEITGNGVFGENGENWATGEKVSARPELAEQLIKKGLARKVD